MKGPRIHRPAASATWEHEHLWGPMLCDRTTLRVTRTDDGELTIAYGTDSITIRGVLVPHLAEMVEQAASWRDTNGADR